MSAPHPRPLLALASLVLVAVAALAATVPTPAPSDAYRQEIEAWQHQRLAGLQKDEGWLTLVGLFWLQPGANSFGSDPGNRVVLPAGKAPGVAGRFMLTGDNVEVRVEPGLGLTADGQTIGNRRLLKSDAKGGTPTVLRLGTLSFYVIQRGDHGEKVGIRVKDNASPARAAFHGLDYFPVDPSWRVEARFEPYKPAKSIPIANVLGGVDATPSPGAVVFQRGGKSYRIDALEGDDGGLFLVFADQTSGKETYGAGRFLDTGAPKDGKVVVDFNQAYNPPCAFTTFATCPLPPRQNKLAVAIEAGEKKYGEGHP